MLLNPHNLTRPYRDQRSAADELFDEMFGMFVRDFNGYATDLVGKASTTSEQAELARAILHQPGADPARSNHVWEKHVFVHKDMYEMNP